MKVSVIIPVYHRARLLQLCLEAVRRSTVQPDEIIVVDDCSEDETRQVAESFGCRVFANQKRQGQAFSKNQAVVAATGDIYICIDSDVVIEPDAIRNIVNIFSTRAYLDAVVAMPLIENEFHSFASQYKSAYMRYLFSDLPDEIDFLHGSLVAYRSGLFVGNGAFRFDESVWCDDVQLGCALRRAGKQIGFCRDALYVHNRKHSLKSLLYNDYRCAKEFMRIILTHKLLSGSLQEMRFAHTSLMQAMSVGSSMLGLFLLLFGIVTLQIVGVRILAVGTLVFLVGLILRSRFFLYLWRVKGLKFMLRAVVFTGADQLAFGYGMIAGMMQFSKRWLRAALLRPEPVR